MQPPSGGCVLKHMRVSTEEQDLTQPPSGGCVLKLTYSLPCRDTIIAAAFGRLCVETKVFASLNILRLQPPSGGCVLKLYDQS